jgi:hypothetical protein
VGEMRRSRYLAQQDAQVRAGARLLVAIGLLLTSWFAASLALFGGGMRDLRAALSRISLDPWIVSASSLLPWLLVGSAVGLAATLITRHRWLWSTLGAWLTALVLTTATVWAYSLPGEVDFATFFSIAAIALGVVFYWAVRRFGAPGA